MRSIFSVGVMLTVLQYCSGFVNLADVECGAEPSRSGRIVGGSASRESEIPWAVSIWRNGAHQCGATVVTHSWLLTAGHCVCSDSYEFYRARQLTFVAGYHDLAATDEKESLTKIIPHPEYRCEKTANDVALLRTRRQLRWTPALRPACLPQPRGPDYSGAAGTVAGWGWTHEDRGKAMWRVNLLRWTPALRPACLPQPRGPDYRGAVGTVAGWGWTHEDREKGMRPDVLQKVDVIVVENSKCTQWYQSQGMKIQVTATQMCAGHEQGGRDSCWADSGGPLTVREDTGRSLVAGVVSTGHGCARVRLPGIYTRVSQYMDWIISSIKEKDRARIASEGLEWYPK